MNELVLKVCGVSKQYRYGAIGRKTLGADLKDRAKKLLKRDLEQTRERADRFFALDKVSFEVKKGEKIAIIGGNGAGKSTLLRLIARITAPTEGDIYINGRISSILQIGTGFHGELTGRENIYLNGTILGMTKSEIDAKIDEIIEFSECGEFIDTPVKRYSSGMFVKLAFSVAVHLDNEILIMDEVLAVGDVRFQQKCISKLNEIATSEGKTILFVSHNMNSVRQLCNRSIVLKKGKIIFDGDVSTGIEHYMNINRGGEESFFDFSREKRGGLLTLPNTLQSAELQNGKAEGEFLVKLKLNSREDVENARLSFVIMSADNHPIGTVSGSEFCLKKDTEADVLCKLSLNNLQEGVYAVTLALSARMSNDRVLGLDRVPNAFVLHKGQNGSGVKLNPSMFGAVVFDEAETELC